MDRPYLRKNPHLKNDLEKMRRADLHLKEALHYLRKCDDPERVLPIIAGLRRLRMQMDLIFEAALPRHPGEEYGAKR